jgi:uroporphyrinogen-III synthase
LFRQGDVGDFLFTMPSVILTRSDEENHRCVRLFEAHGLQVVSAPMIELRPIPLTGDEMAGIWRNASGAGILLTSSFATRLWLQLRQEMPGKLDVMGYYVVGERSAMLLHEADPAVPVRAVGGSAQELLQQPLDGVQRLIYPCSAMRRDEMVSGLAARGVAVLEVPLYAPERPVSSHEVLRRAVADIERPVALCFFSPSAAENFFSLPIDFLPGGIFFAAIGETTAESLRSYGVRDVIMPETPDSAALAETVAGRLAKA